MNEHRGVRRLGRAHQDLSLSTILTPVFQSAVTIPVTLWLIVIHVVVFLKPGPLAKVLPDSNSVCDLSRRGSVVSRWLLPMVAMFIHARASHLIYDIILLLGAGLLLERSLGSLCFAATVAFLEGFSQWLRFVVSSCLGTFSSYLSMSNCVIGCSTTLFALKMVMEKQSLTYLVLPELPALLGITTWVGLFMLYASVPQTSVTAHICGMLAGYVYAHLNVGLYTTMMIQNMFWLLLNAVMVLGNRTMCTAYGLLNYQNGHGQREGTINGAGSDSAAAELLQWSCQSCNRKNGVFLSSCDYCGTPRNGSNIYVPSAPLWDGNDR